LPATKPTRTDLAATNMQIKDPEVQICFKKMPKKSEVKKGLLFFSWHSRKRGINVSFM